MKASKRHVVVGALFLSLAFAPLSFAQNEESGVTPERVGTPLRGRVEGLRDRLLDRKEGAIEKRGNATSSVAERRGERMEQMRSRVRAFSERMIKRIQAAFERLEKLVARIEARVAKLEETNKNIQTGEAKKYIADAKGLILSGKASLNEAESLIEETVTSDSPRESFQKVHDLVKASTADLRKAHEAIKNALRSLKSAIGKGAGSATTTQ